MINNKTLSFHVSGFTKKPKGGSPSVFDWSKTLYSLYNLGNQWCNCLDCSYNYQEPFPISLLLFFSMSFHMYRFHLLPLLKEKSYLITKQQEQLINIITKLILLFHNHTSTAIIILINCLLCPYLQVSALENVSKIFSKALDFN